jgi:hypothetical protein
MCHIIIILATKTYSNELIYLIFQAASPACTELETIVLDWLGKSHSYSAVGSYYTVTNSITLTKPIYKLLQHQSIMIRVYIRLFLPSRFNHPYYVR